MKAVYINEFGSIDGLALADVDAPRLAGGDDVLVRVHAAGLNRADLLQVRGMYPPPVGFSANIPGLEFAGEIVKVGENVTEWKVGTRVFGITAGEAQAEYVLTASQMIAEIPDHLNYPEAACVPEAFITASDALLTLGELGMRSSVLIHAVGSGVGLAALQIAKARDAFVIGTSRTASKLERCASMGLDRGIVVDSEIDFASQVLEATDGRGVDVIVELVGGAYVPEDLKCIANQGRIVLVGLTGGRKAEIDLGLVLQKRARIIGTVLRSRPAEEKISATRLFAEQILPLFSNGITPDLDRVFPATEVRDAYSYLASNESFGKVVLEF
ncbi:MAG: NAD(P)H-quinone oxidoreductase [Pyrinomonadaceae bacterium]